MLPARAAEGSCFMKVKITKGKVTAAVVIAAVLVISFVWGGGYARPDSDPDKQLTGLASPGGIQTETTGPAMTSGAGITTEPAITTPEAITPAATDLKTQAGTEIDQRPGGAEGGLSADEKVKLAASMGGSSPGVQSGSKDYSEAQGMEIQKDTGKDKYLTDPVPEGKPVPVEPQNATITDKKMTCTLSVRCDTILKNISWLDPEKVELVPEDGVIFAAQKVTFYEGESVFNLLQREMKKNKIHMEFMNTPIYNSAYIEGIHNLYEFDCGELSGWMYQVNGWFPNYGCSRYQLKEGDVVEWVYTCDLGRDVGGFYSTGGE